MPGWSMINGVWREMWKPAPNINGVIRNSNVYANINNVHRLIYTDEFDISSIIGFRLVYTRDKVTRHELFPNLSYNPNIPARAYPTGDRIGFMDHTPKGILIEYDKDPIQEEGTFLYEGRLYAQLMNNEVIDVTHSSDDPFADERVPVRMKDVELAWYSSRIMNCDIRINYYYGYESYGYKMFGWNRMFSTEDFLFTTDEFNQRFNKNTHIQNSYNILPVDSRVDTFDLVARVGIVRDLTNPDRNMIGSHGTLSQDIHHIWLNGIAMPFVIEVYD